MIKNKILLICGTPPTTSLNIEDGGVPLSTATKTLVGISKSFHLSHPPLGAVVLATYLRPLGFDVEVKDWYLDEITIYDYSIIGISGTFLDKCDLQNIAKHVKSKNPKCILIVGGPISWSYPPTEILESICEIDILVLREGEITFHKLLSALTNNTNYQDIMGIAFRGSTSVRINPQPEPLSHNEIVSPDWSVLNLKGRVPLLSIEGARGCSYQCAYCSEATYWGKPVRFRSIDSLIKEIKNNVDQFGIKTFRWTDSCFTAPSERCERLCDALIDNFTTRGVPLQWSSFARISNLNQNLLEKMKAAGCVAIDIGMESGNEDVLKKMNKHYSRNDIIESIRASVGLDIITHCNVVVGFPGETINSIEDTISILNSAKPHSYHLMQLFMAPNTAISMKPADFGIRGYRLQWEHRTMSSDDIPEIMKKIVANVTYSSLVLAGETVAIILIACGYSSEDIRVFFQNLQSDNISPQDIAMMNAIAKKPLKNQAC